MRYADVKVGQLFDEERDRKKPKRWLRRLKVIETSMYSARCQVVDGRGTGFELMMPLKRLTDLTQWKLA